MSTTTVPLVGPAAPTARAEVVRTLSAAFAEDPVFAWILPDRDERAAALPEVFAGFAEAYERHRAPDLAVVDGLAAGAALWARPGVEAVHPDDAPALGARLSVLSTAAQERVDACLEVFGAAHPSESAWYLGFLGVDPWHQGRGVGSALLRTVLVQADVSGEPAYLEATSPRNRALYERHGFRCTAELPLPGGPTAYAMWRVARPPTPPTALTAAAFGGAVQSSRPWADT